MDPNLRIWEHSYRKSKPFWNLYEKLVIDNHADVAEDEIDSPDAELDNEAEEETVEEINPEYLEFIKQTREHQRERDRLKKQSPQVPIFEEESHIYYKDISQVNTLVEANLATVPNKHDMKPEASEEFPAQDSIRLMEMYIDEHFSKKLQEQSASYWPTIPINVKPYLNEKIT